VPYAVIGQEHADAVLAQEVERGGAVGGEQHMHALALEDLGQRFDDCRFVIDHQHDPALRRGLLERDRLVRHGMTTSAFHLGRRETPERALGRLVPHTGTALNKRSASLRPS
jgi:hypothetical protein